ncbi:hypothetical protein AQUCO_01400319v1 [Aquilegia coerulea]|uniref:Ribonuclease H1 N-terminal domain-containing protein n=1 Tax=Aquilegia coerulea TaxID=218851 RepID=A0A2G5DVR7_AQUCA|nr:hypothetical protein AQUCO_01400319v1 [Aquilegia coerulea]
MDKKDNKYAVYRGRNPGVYDSWLKAKQQVDKYPRNCYEKLDPVTGKSPSKPYVVHRGREPGVYDSWRRTHPQVVGHPNASYEKAKSFDDAHGN